MFLVAGTAFAATGIVGVFVPLLPTTPLMLLAAACYARGSNRLHDALVNSRLFGPTIREWRRHRSVPFRTKWTAVALMGATLATSIVLAVENAYERVGLAVFGVVLAVWMARIPSRDRPRRS